MDACRLVAAAQHGVLNMMPLTCDWLAKLLPRLLPAAWQNAAAAVSWAPAKDAAQPSEAWLRLFWDKSQVPPRAMSFRTASGEACSGDARTYFFLFNSPCQRSQLKIAEYLLRRVREGSTTYRLMQEAQTLRSFVGWPLLPVKGRPPAPAPALTAVACGSPQRRLANGPGNRAAEAGLPVRPCSNCHDGHIRLLFCIASCMAHI